MTAPLYLLDPLPEPAWAPFGGARPVSELRAGVWRIRERWEAALGTRTAAILGDHVAGFHELDEPPCRPLEPVHGPAIVARADVAPAGGRVAIAPGVERLTCGGATAAWIVPEGATWRREHHHGAEQPIEGVVLRGAFDLLGALETFLAADCADFLAHAADPTPEHAIILGDPARIRCFGATVEPGVVFDVRAGAIVLERGAEARHGTRIEGPCYVGPGTRLMGGDVRASVFGPRCVVRGEVSGACFTGYANKAHDGFVGHSVLGQWVNLGAGTTTSNLKNTYGPVRLVVAGTPIDTGRQFLGTLFGDHVKTAIGTLLATGTVVGVGANVFGPGLGKYVRPFAWGSTGVELLDEAGFLRTAERVLPRRQVEFTAARRDALAALHRRHSAR